MWMGHNQLWCQTKRKITVPQVTRDSNIRSDDNDKEQQYEIEQESDHHNTIS